ncbi:MAG: sigma-54 dependent transcriptional regulator [Desulfobacterales bacterium]
MTQSMKILVVDDEEPICEALNAWLVKDGYHVDTAFSGQAAVDRIRQCLFDLYLIDIKMPGMGGIELLGRIKETQPDANVIMITAHGSIQTAVEAMKLGACDYICKPFDPEELSLLIERVSANQALKDENVVLREQLMEVHEKTFEGLVVESDALREVFESLKDVAPISTPVLVTGETGVGKEMVARVIHSQSERAYGPFVAINCGAQSETLLESELFGHERGAFTGAVKARRGRIEMANKGTLFLDEIGEISPKMQVSLLRVLEEKRFQRLGGSQLINSDFRLISATHRDLSLLVKEQQFREDFYYRINVITVNIPPLRERLADIPVLADHFLDRYVQETGKQVRGFTQMALDMLKSYLWPGNVRELRNVIERAVVIARGRMIGADELSFLQSSSDECKSGSMTLKEMEISYVKTILEDSDWNITRSAKRLGVDRSTLTRKIKRYNLKRR